MRFLIAGGCKQGKSTLAQALAMGQGGARYYIATMRPRDTEDNDRILRHRREREGLGFETIECFSGVDALAGKLPQTASLLLDSTTALLAEEMFAGGARVDLQAPARVQRGLLALAAAHAHVVFVTDTLQMDGVRYDETTQAYLRGMAALDRALYGACGAAVEMVYGLPVLHKGDEAVEGRVRAVCAGLSDGAGAVHGATGPCALG